jgi:hypothetical protein
MADEYHLTAEDMREIQGIAEKLNRQLREDHHFDVGEIPHPPVALMGMALGFQMASAEILMGRMKQPLMHYLMSATCASADVVKLSDHDQKAHHIFHTLVDTFPDGDFPLPMVLTSEQLAEGPMQVIKEALETVLGISTDTNEEEQN